MGLEAASFISQLTASNPDTADQIKDGDNHIRLIKAVLQNTFPGLSFSVTFNSATKAIAEQASYAAVRALLDAPVLTGDNKFLSTDAGAAAGPKITLFRNSASAADGDIIGEIDFSGNDDAGTPNERIYASFIAKIVDSGTTSEDGELEVHTIVAGTRAKRFVFGQGIYSSGLTDPGVGKANFNEVQVLGVPVQTGMPQGYFYGLSLTNNGADPVNDIDVAAGAARSLANTADIVLASAITKRLDAAWAVGTNQGGLDTGTKTNSTWYYAWLIKRTDTGVVDVLFSTSRTAPTMPGSYTEKRRLKGAFKVDGSGNIVTFVQSGETFTRKAIGALDVSSSAFSTTATLVALDLPTGKKWPVQLRVVVDTASRIVTIQDPDLTDVAPLVNGAPLGDAGWDSTNGVSPASQINLVTNTSSQVRVRSDGAATTVYAAWLSFTDDGE